MLDSLPIVKFGDREGTPEQQKQDEQGQRDIEMNSAQTSKAASIAASAPTTDGNQRASTEAQNLPTNADGTDAEGQLGCSICTDDFNKGEEVRVLPCNHKFHPDCVDPWLLNVSGTCPLCRVDLRPKNLQASEADDTIQNGSQSVGTMPPPLAYEAALNFEASRRRETLATLRQLAMPGAGSREERIAALRRLRQERRPRQESEPHEEAETERRGLARRFRERFRIRTVRTEGDEPPG
jgi:hypothetical protein